MPRYEATLTINTGRVTKAPDIEVMLLDIIREGRYELTNVLPEDLDIEINQVVMTHANEKAHKEEGS